jgi:hypothetical protein
MNECRKIYLIGRKNGTTLWCIINAASDWHSCTYIHLSYQGAVPVVTGGSWLSLLVMISPKVVLFPVCYYYPNRGSSRNKVESCLKADEHKTDDEVEWVSQGIQHAWSGIRWVINYSKHDTWERTSWTLWFETGTVFWDIMLKVDWYFRGKCCYHLQDRGISQARNQRENIGPFIQ